MRTTIEIPDETYRQLKIKAAQEGKPLRQIVLQGIERELRGVEPQPKRKKFRFPVIRSKNPGSLKLGEEGVYEYIPFP
jgi:hypothetical protein